MVKEEMSHDVLAILREGLKKPVLSLEETKKLIRRYREENDKTAREKLLLHNLRLVVAVAKKYARKNQEILPDLIQEGFLGLCRAVDKFNCSLGYKFSTYAILWIKLFAYRAKPNISGGIKASAYLVEEARKYQRIFLEFSKKSHREPEIQEIASAMNISDEEALILSQFGVASTSFDLPTMESVIFQEINIEKEVFKNEATEKIMEVIKEVCNEKEIAVLSQRYALNGKEESTLKEIGERFNLSKARISVIELRAIKKIKKNKIIRNMASEI